MTVGPQELVPTVNDMKNGLEFVNIHELGGKFYESFSFHFFILKFFKEGNPSANMLVFKGPSN